MSVTHPRRNSLTARAQQCLLPVLSDAVAVIDATAGNGRDTAFLAQASPDTCRVFAFDVQAEAIEQARLHCAPWQQKITWIHGSHAHIATAIPASLHGCVQAIMFNLGYLPGGTNKALCTQPDSTLTAIEQSMACLADTGIISLLCYTGHEGGMAEFEAIMQASITWQRAGWNITSHTPDTNHPTPPRHILMRRCCSTIA
jgi:SAM-dependent methyltransferase